MKISLENLRRIISEEVESTLSDDAAVRMRHRKFVKEPWPREEEQELSEYYIDDAIEKMIDSVVEKMGDYSPNPKLLNMLIEFIFKQEKYEIKFEKLIFKLGKNLGIEKAAEYLEMVLQQEIEHIEDYMEHLLSTYEK